jgi:Tfp pilus assembly protein PilF
VNYRRGAWTEARADFNRALALRPTHFWSQFFLAVCQLRLGDWQAARAGFSAGLAQRTDFIWTHFLRGFANEKLSAFREAEDDFATAFRLDPDGDARYTLLLTRGVLRFQQKQLEQAADDFRSAIAQKPEQYNAYANLAWVHLAKGDFDQAARQVELASRLHPPLLVFLGYYVERARLLCQAGKYTKALADCDAALRVAPESPLAHGVRARCLLELKRYREAESDYDADLSHEVSFHVTQQARGIHQVAFDGKVMVLAGNFDGQCVFFPDKLAVLVGVRGLVPAGHPGAVDRGGGGQSDTDRQKRHQGQEDAVHRNLLHGRLAYDRQANARGGRRQEAREFSCVLPSFVSPSSSRLRSSMQRLRQP